MAQSEFSVHLGGGLYMDSAGALSQGRDPGNPVYPLSGGGLPIDPKALAAAFQGLAKALPNADDPKSRQKFDEILDDIGMTDENKNNLIGVLQAAGAVASVIGSVVPVVGAALAILTALLGFLKEGPSALEVMVMRRFDDLERKVQALEIQGQQHFLQPQRSTISAALAALKDYTAELQQSPLNEAMLSDRHALQVHLRDSGKAVRNLLGSSVWLASFDGDDYEAVWPWVGHRLVTFSAEGAPQRARMPLQGANGFDHSVMVPLAMFAVTTYLAVLRAAAPEFRSTRKNRQDLWDFADAIETLMNNMRGQTLTRTLYTTADFQSGPGGIPQGLDPSEVIDHAILGLAPRLAEGNTRFAVGAFDMCTYDDAYFTAGFSAGRIQFPGLQYAKQGLLNVRWIPPARLESYDEQVTALGWEPADHTPATWRRYRITNPEECAQAANAQSEQDYADLLYSSGYLNLVHMLATLRNEATDPNRSQTVRSEASLRGKAGPSSAVVVKSVPITSTEVISADARRQSHQFKGTTWFTTQPLGRNVQLPYRVWLRTLHGSQEYPRSFYQVDYEEIPDQPGAQRLVTSTGTALDEVMIAEGISRPEVFQDSKPVTLKVTTYDLWVPVKQPSSEWSTHAAASSAARQAAGWLWVDAEEPAKAQRRLTQESEVRLDCTVHWQADKLTVSLSNNRAEDRNYVIYVVVEETLVSGAVLHTFERVPVTGQLTFVPQSFFDEEFDALAKTARFFRDFATRYAKSLPALPRPGGPGDPDPDWFGGLDQQVLASDPVMRELELTSPTGAEDFTRLFTIVAQHPPAAAMLRQMLAEVDGP